jgi:uncharacterized membrane protein YqjE
VSDDAPERIEPTGGLRRGLARAACAAIELVRTRVELAALEFSEQRDRAKLTLILGVVAATFFAFAILCASALVVLFFWDTHRVAAMAVVTLVHLGIGAGALWRLKAVQREATPPFEQTLAELDRDRRWIAGELHDTIER